MQKTDTKEKQEQTREGRNDDQLVIVQENKIWPCRKSTNVRVSKKIRRIKFLLGYGDPFVFEIQFNGSLLKAKT